VAANAPARLARATRLRGIYAIVNEDSRTFELAQAVLDAGVRVLQYRAKSGIVEAKVDALRRLAAAHDALLILNDDWRAAARFGCDGVHLGPGDDGFTNVFSVRDALPNGVIGLSCGSLAEVRAANACDIDYVGAGSVYATRSKGDAGAPIGLQGLRAIVRACNVPIVAIGGIDVARIPEVKAAGAAMAAIISAVAGATDPRLAAAALVEGWQR